MKAYRLATPEDHTDGMAWYREAHAFASSLDTDVSRAAGVIAALSPNTSWPTNMRLATNHYAGVFGGTFGDATRKAQRILAGEPVESVLRGDKVTAFYANIMGDPAHVTIDRHAIDIACGKPMSDRERSVWMGKRNRAVLVDAYRRAAAIATREAGETVHPYQVQAVTWVWWRKNRAVAFHG